jgi:NAD(P)-dependent dehydrogenase (short-subunit alcohol dehydrogenase family)
MNMPMDMRGTAAVITGGGRGLGLAIARDLAAQGAGIALLDVLAEVADTAAALATDSGVPTVGIICGVRDAGVVDTAVGTAEGRHGVAANLVT